MTTRPPGKWLLFLAILFLLLPFRLTAKDNWIEVRSPNFTVISNAGENEARRIADQFEKFRELFHDAFPNFRVDLGKPLIIVAVRNEDTLKILLPEYWEVKGRMHPAGVFMPGEAQDYVAVRTDIEADNPYEVVYHEYTHAIMNLNVQSLPVWMGEGLAELFANSAIHEKDVEYGKPSPYHLQILQTSRLIPIEALMTADANSPFYNEQNHASVFYAESWAIVHYLMLDPEARKRQLLGNFLTAWDATGDQVASAKKAFGDLNKFSVAMESYARQHSFYYGRIKIALHADPKSYASRSLSPAEVAAQESIFFIQHRRMKEAASSADAALAADPNLGLAHEARGILAFHEQDYPGADKELSRSLELDPKSYIALYYEAQARMRAGMTSYADLPVVTGYLEKAVALNPQFAPAYAVLSNFYSFHPETREKALATGKKATELEPGNLNYAISYGYVLVNVGDIADAKVLAGRILAAARTPQELQSAASFQSLVSNRENAAASSSYRSQMTVAQETAEDNTEIEGPKQGEPNPNAAPLTVEPVSPPSPTQSSRRSDPTINYQLEGKIVSADCPKDGELTIALSINWISIKFRAPDPKTVQLTPANKVGKTDQAGCAGWIGQRVKITFHSPPQGEFAGELTAIYFF